MPQKKLTLDPAVVLEWLIENDYVESTSSANAPYRLATSETDFMPYTITFLTKKLSERFSKTKLRSTHRKVWKRELYRCLDEYQIQYVDGYTRSNYHWEFKTTTKKYLEQKLGINLDAIHEHDRRQRHERKGGVRYTSYYNQAKGRYGEEKALKLFLKYFNRRMEDLDKDCRNGRPRRRKIED